MNAPVFTTDTARTLADELGRLAPRGRVAVLADSNTAQCVLPALRHVLPPDTLEITVSAGESSKGLDTLSDVWLRMSTGGMTRHSLLVCVGGGVVTDLGGFAAATFKRGITCINIPTSLLAMVDASTGGKTGIDFAGLKNEIGAFAPPEAVIVSPQWLATLPDDQWLSGYGEMIKHSLLDPRRAELPSLENLRAMEPRPLLEVIRHSVGVKRHYADSDPLEKTGARAALNLGHTVGHAIEALMVEQGRPLPHGTCVAYGTVAALMLSRITGRMEASEADKQMPYSMARRVRHAYGPMPVECSMYERLLELMRHDKKNLSTGEIRFTLLDSPGHPATGIAVSTDDIKAALDITRDFC